MSELRARNVKPNGEVKDVKGSVGAQVSLLFATIETGADEQVNKDIKKVEQSSYVRSFVAILGLLAVGFFGVRVNHSIEASDS
jgi:hypothetical protein